MTTDAASPMIILKSNDGASFELTKRAACMADFVKDSLGDNEDDDGGDDDNDNNKVVVDVLRVNGECLAKVVDFLKHHDEEAMPEIPTPLGGNTFREVRIVRVISLYFVQAMVWPYALCFEARSENKRRRRCRYSTVDGLR